MDHSSDRTAVESHRIAKRLQLLIGGFAVQRPTRSIAAIRRRVCMVAVRQDGPSRATSLCGALRRAWIPRLRLAPEGEKLYPQAFDLIHRREVSCPNEIWQADHTQFAIGLLDERG